MGAIIWLVLVFSVALGAPFIESYPYQLVMDGERPDLPPSRTHWLGTDAVCRDRYSRLVQGTRVSVLLAPLAALLASLVGGLVGSVAGMAGGWFDLGAMAACDLCLSLPWFFLLIAARAMLPLNAPPGLSVLLTFLLLGLLGWAGPARIIRSRSRELAASDQILVARALGVSPWRIVFIYLLPGLRPALTAQFWIAIPVFILGEANLSLVGLGVAEPLPSWGNLLRDFERPDLIASTPWVIAPLLMLVASVLSLQIILRPQVNH